MPTYDELKMLQALPLEVKVAKTKQRIKEWVDYYGESGVYVSFSGGKDSTVLLHIVRSMYPNVEAVFVDTGLEYPEIREFVKTFENVTWLKPEMQFKNVIETYGYPFISKEVSEKVAGAKIFIKDSENLDVKYNRYCRSISDLLGIPRDSNFKETDIYKKLSCFKYKNENHNKYRYSLPSNILITLGTLPHKENGNLTNESSNRYNYSKYLFLLDAPFNVSNKCCSVMKKKPAHAYAKQSGKVSITGQMAQESMLRRSQWLKSGCNAFESVNPVSNPLSFWLEQDILRYIKENDIEICSAYGEIVDDVRGTENVDGQLTMSDLLGVETKKFDADRPKLRTTGCDRTGCMFCGYGCHLEKEGEGRFERMKITHPKQYEWIMKPWDKGGLGYKEVIDWLNKNGNLNIRY